MKTTVFRCWQNQTNSYDLCFLDNDYLLVRIATPFTYKWIQIINSDNKVFYSNIYQSSEYVCNLKLSLSGTYYFCFYVSENGIRYNPYICKRDIIIERQNNKSYFRLPYFTKINIDLIKNNQLKYVLNKPILPNDHTMRRFVNDLTSKSSDIREKVLIIHDFVAKNLYYDFDSLKLKDIQSTNRSIEEIVNTRRCVCQGYADLTLVLLHSLGLQAENILCYAITDVHEHGWSLAKNRESDYNHIMTRVKLENRWLYMDVTWDSGNRYEDGEYKNENKVSHRYFDMTIPFLSATHRFFNCND